MNLVLYGNTVQAWAIAGGAALAALAILVLVRRVATVQLSALSRRTRTELDDIGADISRRTRFVFLLVVALYAGASLLVIGSSARRALDAILVIALVGQAGLWGNAVITHSVRRHLQRRVEDDAATAMSASVLGFLAHAALWTVLLLLGLDNLGIDITALVAGLGVGGVAIALAVQSILGDLFASLSIVLDRPFVVGDFVVVDDLKGTVEHVGLKTTRLRSLSGEQLVFSNTDLLKSRIRNFKRMQERRSLFTLGVTYETSPEHVAAIPGMIREIIEGVPGTRFDRAHFARYGAFSLDFEVVYFMLDPDYNHYMDVQQAINLAILERFGAAGIVFAYPTQTLHIQRQTPAVHA